MKAKEIDHVCIAVKDLASARKIYEETFGMELALEYIAAQEKIKVARYYLGTVALELMESTTPDGGCGPFHREKGRRRFFDFIPRGRRASRPGRTQGQR